LAGVGDQPGNWEEFAMTCKPYDIPKTLVWEAWLHVKANQGAAGIDAETIERFEDKLGDNLYKIWNRMSSGSYFPPPVKAVPLPKKTGGVRILGIPTVADRVAQTAVKVWLEPRLEPIFRDDSFGYRPGKSALAAIAVTRRRCWDCDWVVEFDIRGLFDNLDHDLLMRALRKHCQEPWILLYVERWLKAPMQTTDGQIQERDKARRRAVLSRRCWPTYFCTTRLICGWRNISPAFGMPDTLMMRCFTARANARQNTCLIVSGSGSRPASSNCILARHGLCIARTSIGTAITLQSSSRFLVIRSGLARQWTSMAGFT
jgi:Reverse transcriptase (RNA-dependent DNA polymerase)